jgi:hypothetical protein
MYHIWYTGLVSRNPESSTPRDDRPEAPKRQGKRVPAIFYRTEAGGEPVREWLKGLPPEDRKWIREDIKTVEFGWPIGMPVCRPLGEGIYEVRTAWGRTELLACFSTSTGGAGWSCCTDLSRKRGRRRKGIWTWLKATKLSIREDCNERTKKSKKSGPQWVNLR